MSAAPPSLQASPWAFPERFVFEKAGICLQVCIWTACLVFCFVVQHCDGSTGLTTSHRKCLYCLRSPWRQTHILKVQKKTHGYLFFQRNKMIAVFTKATNFFSKFKVQTDVLKCRKCHKPKDRREQILEHTVRPDSVPGQVWTLLFLTPQGARLCMAWTVWDPGPSSRPQVCPVRPGDHTIGCSFRRMRNLTGKLVVSEGWKCCGGDGTLCLGNQD